MDNIRRRKVYLEIEFNETAARPGTVAPESLTVDAAGWWTDIGLEDFFTLKLKDDMHCRDGTGR